MADIGFNASLTVNDGAAQAQTAFPNDVLVTLPAREVGSQETTKHGQGDRYRRKVPTLTDPGVLKVETYYDHTTYTRLDALLGQQNVPTSAVPVAWVVKAPQGVPGGPTTPQQFQFNGFVSKLDELPFEREGIMVIKFEVTLSGPWTITPGT